jgi:transcriptional regulator with PAS, ATPase and Fis domain
LENYDWPGNVRQLENIIHRAVAISGKATIDNTHLPSEVTGRSPSSPDTAMPKTDTLAAYELMAIENALKKSDGNCGPKIIG